MPSDVELDRKIRDLEVTLFGQSGQNGMNGTVKSHSQQLATLYTRDEDARQKMDDGFKEIRNEIGTKFRWVYVQLALVLLALVGGLFGIIAALTSIGGAPAA